MTLAAYEPGTFSLFLRTTEEDGTVSVDVRFNTIPIAGASVATLLIEPEITEPTLLLDIDGNNVVDFTLEANSPPEAGLFLIVLVEIVSSSSMPRGIQNSLLKKLESAQAALDRGNMQATRGKLKAFVNAVRAQRGKTLPEEQADVLLQLAESVLSIL